MKKQVDIHEDEESVRSEFKTKNAPWKMLCPICAVLWHGIEAKKKRYQEGSSRNMVMSKYLEDFIDEENG